MHWKDARADGESEQRLYSLPAWRETPFYSEREQAGLLLAEELTLAAHRHIPEDVFVRVRMQFNDREFADLLWCIAAINTWNRLSIGAGNVPGLYQPPKKAAS